MGYNKLRQFTYELPQTLLGLLLSKAYTRNVVDTLMYKDSEVNICKGFPGGISLGRYILISDKYSKYQRNNVIKHEYGHCLQSRKLGWLYLFIIGIPSIVWAGLYGTLIKKTNNGYYKFFTEKWADKLGGVKRGNIY